MQPIISVIVPCYNQAQYLHEALQSVLDQTYRDWECIIVNDGSPDNTEEIALEWCDKDSRFKYLKKENGGIADARNCGIEKAMGTYILPLDADDKISSDFLEEGIHIFKNDITIKLVYPKVIFFGIRNGEWNLPLYSYDKFLFCNMIVCSAIFRKQDFLKIGGYNTGMLLGWEDWDFWLKFLQPEDKVIRLENACFYYRIKEQSRNTVVHSIDNQEELYWQIFENNIKLYRRKESYIGLKNQLDYLLIKRDLLLQSKEYRVGKVVMAPFRMIYDIFLKFRKLLKF